MGYKVLVTLDLPNANEDQRNAFYEVLANEKWSKIKSLTTAWTVSFKDTVERDGAIATLKSDLEKAKTESKLRKVEYALLMDKIDVIISTL
jgi:xanthine/uracil/vitamin C permease (AzgA family)